MAQDELAKEIGDAFRGYAPSACRYCGTSLEKEVMAIEDTFTTHILTLIQPAIEQIVVARCGECDKWLSVEWQKQNVAEAIEQAREVYVKLTKDQTLPRVPSGVGYCRNMQREMVDKGWRKVELPK